MSQSMEITAASLSALTEQYRAITQNLANANTVGFKRRVSNFRQILEQAQAAQAGGAVNLHSDGLRNRIALDFTQGVLDHSQRPLDLGIDGKGFFVVETTNGPLYTRNGTFVVNEDGKLCDTQGRLVAGDSGPITVPENISHLDVTVAHDGTVMAGGQNIGKVKIVTFEDTARLEPNGKGCFVAPPDVRPETPEPGEGRVLQGFRENSNVSAVEELINLMQVTRLYEAGIKSFNAQDERLQTLLRMANS